MFHSNITLNKRWIAIYKPNIANIVIITPLIRNIKLDVGIFILFSFIISNDTCNKNKPKTNTIVTTPTMIVFINISLIRLVSLYIISYSSINKVAVITPFIFSNFFLSS